MSNQGPRRPPNVPHFRRRPYRIPDQPIKMETHDENSRCEKPTQHEVRLVLLGKTGAGKSASGNTILGEECFHAEVSMGSVTKECKRERRTVAGRDLLLVDTPGLFDTDLTDQQLQQELIHCLTLCSPGPHAFLLVVPIERYTQEQQRTVEMIREMFQHDITNRTIIVFSHADRLQGTSIDQFLSRQNPKVQKLVEMFGKRYVAFDNTDPAANQDQVSGLLEMVDEVLLHNANVPFSNEVTGVILKAQAMIDEKRVMKIKQEVQKEADDRWAAFPADLNKDRQDSDKIKKRVRARMNQIDADMKKEEANVKPIPERLVRLRASLEMEQINLRRLEEEERKREQREQNERMNMDLWINEEQRRRESQDNTNDSNYTKMILSLVLLMLGFGIGSFAPVLLAFLFPAAPAVAEAGLATQILLKMLNLVGTGLPAAFQLAALTKCAIQ